MCTFLFSFPVCLKDGTTKLSNATPSLNSYSIKFKNCWSFENAHFVWCLLNPTQIRCLLVLEIYGVSPFVLIFTQAILTQKPLVINS